MCNPLEAVSNAVSQAWNTVTGTINQIISNPLPVITMAAATWALGPSGAGLVSAATAPVLAAGTITAIQGGNIGQIAKNSLLAYGANNFAGPTGIGDVTSYVGSQIGGTAGAMTTAGLNNAFFNSTVAAVGGGNIAHAFGTGFVGGAAGSLANTAFTSDTGKSFFGGMQSTFGLSNTQMKYIQGATLATSTAALSGQDPTRALGNYIAQNISNYGKKEFNEFLDSAKKSYQNLDSSSSSLKTSQGNYEAIKSQYDSQLSTAEQLRTSINAGNAEMKDVIDNNYTPFKNNYDTAIGYINEAKGNYDAWKSSYDVWMEYYNRYAPLNFPGKNEYMNMLVNGINDHIRVCNEQATYIQNTTAYVNDIYTANKPTIDYLNSKKAEIEQQVSRFESIKTNIESPNGSNLASQFLNASNDLQAKFDQFTAAKQSVDNISSQYITKLADIGSHEAEAQQQAKGRLKRPKGRLKRPKGRLKLNDKQKLKGKNKLDKKPLQKKLVNKRRL